ncbi:hypothetical protein KC945_01750 [Candidatus Saccharibacteria bacterium]|nr:hypothetical protein [Candidatus Saccharibacteria bacterium]
MNKRTTMMGAVGGMTVGSVLPWLWGDYNSFDLTSVFFGMIGGFLGIFVAVWLSRYFGD